MLQIRAKMCLNWPMVRITTLPKDNAVLRKPALAVAESDISSAHIQNIIKDMSDTLRGTNDGIGIAAPQIGESLRIFVASEEAVAPDPAAKSKAEWQHWIFINPEITSIAKAHEDDTEGCLSVPNIYGITSRAKEITITAFDEHGKKVTRNATGLFARLFQHEIDHLNGRLFVDHATDLVEHTA